ncbi:MFS transporter [Paraburkholderia sp. DGU8]|uniref:MFS transporter n=1 Tax=Paraburkholderia sp. DGU8 TaxID=3161997 RepID=UPI0034652C43
MNTRTAVSADVSLDTANDHIDRPSRIRTIMTSVAGQILEWYDFFLYGTAAALVFGKLFFPVGQDPLTGTIAAFGGATVGFLARPIGGVICGHLGDRYGRKKTMLLTLGTMGVATFCMGLLPTYQQTGILAPVLLVVLRVVQGLAAGGEWTGSILMISENTPAHRRGYLSAWSPSGAALGFVLSTAAFLVMQSFPEQDFLSWGWRVPFLLSVLIIGVGMYMRTHVPESAEFVETAQRGALERMPVLEAMKRCPRQIMSVFGLRFGEGGASYMFFAFSIVYAKYVGISNTLVLSALTVSMLLLIPMALLSGHLCDRFGRKPLYMAGALGIVIFAYPFFLMFQTRQPWIIVLALVLANSVILGILEGAQPAYISELMPANLRFSGVGIGRELASVLGGGLAPLVATALLAYYRQAFPIALYLGAMGMVTVVTLLFTPETWPRDARSLAARASRRS